TTRSTDLPDGVVELAATLDVRFSGRRGLRTLVEGSIRLDEPSQPGAAYALDGEIVRQDELFDRFRYRFESLPDGAPTFLFERPLRPGSYKLVLRLHD